MNHTQRLGVPYRSSRVRNIQLSEEGGIKTVGVDLYDPFTEGRDSTKGRDTSPLFLRTETVLFTRSVDHLV